MSLPLPPRRILSVFLGLVSCCLPGMPASATVWVATHDWPSRGLSLEALVDDVTDDVQLTIVGPVGVWLSYGFGGSGMTGTYAVVGSPGGGVEERILGNHNAGSLLPSAITVDSWTDLGNGTARFVLSRTRDPGTGAWVFPASETTVPIIFAVGQSSVFGNHGSGNRSSGSVHFGPDAVPAPEGIRSASWGTTKITFRGGATE